MATQDFGLSYTVEIPALWLVAPEGKNGASSSIFAQGIGSLNKHGGTSSLFADLVQNNKYGAAGTLLFIELELDKHGGAVTADTSGLCTPRNILANPGQSILSGPGQSTLSCN